MGTEADNSQKQGQGRNPAWEEFYNAIPEEYREEVQPNIDPILEKWDRGVQQRFESYKPYEKYVNEKIDPQVMDYAMNLLDTLNDQEGALQVFQQLGSYLESEGLLKGQEEAKEPEKPEDEEIDWDSLPPALKKQLEQLQAGVNLLAQERIQEVEAKKEQEQDALLEAELKSLKDKYGEYDEDWVLAKMVNGMDAEEAVQAYNSWLDGMLKARNKPNPSFKALGAGSGAFPSGNGEFDPRKATSREVSSMIAQKLMDLQRDA